jgi:four helix bundle protein
MQEARKQSRPITSYEDLLVYQKSYQLALQIHQHSLKFPMFERVELGRQMRGASKSIAVNIAEGYGRRISVADFRRFLVMAQGSCDEVRVWLSFARDLGYLTADEAVELDGGFQEVGRMLSGLARSWQARTQGE